MSNFNDGDKVICVRSNHASKLTEGETYTVKGTSGARYIRLVEAPGTYYVDRFKLAPKGKTKKAPFGQVKAVTVNKSDIHEVLTQYVRFALGINASVEKIVEKFPDAVELVLSSEAAA
ncbi:hypothetical protein NKG95_29045 [Mesorhizobium sp. M1423]|uniref:hypothetical protein n=1 Tax=Mesorhizobium sp. M1423 TaxID=2957101 RepID=UPI0033372A63